MKKLGFNEFLDKKERDGRHHLNIVRDVLQKGGMKVGDFTEHSDDEPYVFLHNPEQNAMFRGVRIYNIGNTLAFRVQREEKTHPYGTAYGLRIPEMFADLVEDMDQEKAGKKVMESIVKEFKKFFLLSARAESELGSFEIHKQGDPMSNLVVASSGTDMARQVGNSISPV